MIFPRLEKTFLGLFQKVARTGNKWEISRVREKAVECRNDNVIILTSAMGYISKL